MTTNQIFNTYPGFKFWAERRRPIVLYFILYYSLFIIIALIFRDIHIFILFFISWLGIISFQFFTRYEKGLAKYLNLHNENLRLKIFDDKKLHIIKNSPVFKDDICLVYRFENKNIKSINYLSSKIQEAFK